MIDSHAHLSLKQFRSDRAAVLARAREAGVRAIIDIVLRPDDPGAGPANPQGDPGVAIFTAAGIHPHDAAKLDVAMLARLEALADQPGVVAIGEIGLDYYRDLSPRHIQEQAFRRQLALARKKKLPVVIHDRDAHTKVMQILKEEQVSRGVLHCFAGDFGIAKQGLDLGLYLSFAGNITYDGSKAAEVIRKMPVDRLLIETDCPYLAPAPFRGKRNEPAYVRYVAEKVASLLGRPVEEIDALTERNTCECFGLPRV